MTTQELVEKISHLTEEERLEISEQVDNFLINRELSKHYKPYTKEEFIAALEESRRQAEQGQTISAYQALAHIREKYGIPA